MKRSALYQLQEPDFFFWATGIEDTFITEPWPATGRTLDEYELTQHYQRWREDISIISDLGVSHARYGIPWHRINPAKGQWNWEFPDKTLDFILGQGVEPIVDLVHYGLPPWIEGAYLHPDFSRFMAEYAERTAERFKDRIHLWTPLNEPRVTAWYCGKLGWWPPFKKGWKGFLQVILGVCKGIVESSHAILQVDPQNVLAHVDATDLYESPDPALTDEVARRQEIVFLALDLVSGKVTPDHPLWDWLLANGLSEEDLDWFQQKPVSLDLVGINLYPLFSKKILTRSPRLRMKMPYADASIVERLAEMYFARYQAPVFISETASLGSIKKRAHWLETSVAATRKVRERGIPLVGYTWWPLFALVTWAYRQGKHPPGYYIKQMGLWDLHETEGGNLERIPTPLVDQYKNLVNAGTNAIGHVRGEMAAV